MSIDLRGPLEGLRYERENHVAILTLDRPERGNSLTPGMQPIIREIWSEVRDDPWIRVAIVRANLSTVPATVEAVGGIWPV